MSPSFTLNYMVVNADGQRFLTVFLPGLSGRAARDDHPAFEQAVAKLKEAERLIESQDFPAAAALAQKAYDLLDVEQAIANRFESLSDRVSVGNGQVYLDGDPVEGPLMDHIFAAFEAGEDFAPLVKFYEKLLTNPLGHAREALYPWIDTYGLTITDDGDVIGYKAFNPKVDDKTGEVVGYIPSRASKHPDRVNGVEVEVGQYMVVNEGDVVETPRSLVLHEPSQACGDGLHVGNFSYNFGYTCSEKFAVRFSPRDVVNVPNRDGKLRVCRYEILGRADEPIAGAIYHEPKPEPVYVAPEPDEESPDDEDRCWDCEEYVEDCTCDDTPEPDDESCGDPYCAICGDPDAEEDEPADDESCGDPYCAICGDPDAEEDEPADDPETWLDNDKPTLDEIEDEIGSITEAFEAIRDNLGRWVAGRPSQRDPKTGRFSG